MDNERAQWAARMLALRVNGMAVLYPAALRMKHPFPQMEEKYAKLAYCSRYAFSAARSQRTLEEAAPDSVLSFRYLGHIFVKAAPESWKMTENGTRAVWSPLPGVQVVTEIALCDGVQVVTEMPAAIRLRAKSPARRSMPGLPSPMTAPVQHTAAPPPPPARNTPAASVRQRT